ncbi:primosomal protein N' (replication factor Y) - superfamily II helicase [Pararhodobacter sp. CCB-MM2]|uniref:primosomal protein N' (replication factor Y) - superfamily II helicase n=1 Tax=Pararhodobacter sp. CCB-MM2 TaxID=1786003 RepID=UPI0008350B03|nr:primosomal protein N' (replication factor Y) - superfamily II helicase [Pararhodobacter sp. CCB-MM2]MCA2013445.1 primosomal protein N' (replication factor Y) - superfamily II helicase [Cereibacter sphaeroides]
MPPAAPEAEAEAPQAHEHRFPCENCGAQLRFSPGQRRLTCQYCGHEQDIPHTEEQRDAALETFDLREALADHLPPEAIEEHRVLSCNNCGAQVEFDPAQHAASCPFCGSPVVTDTGTQRQIKPGAVLPFKMAEREAHEAMRKWLGRLWFAPSKLKEFARSDSSRLDGLYVPYWSFDSDTQSQYTGERGDAYYENRTVMKDGKKTTERVRKIRWTRVRGRVSRDFRDMLIMASQSLPRTYVRALEPWMLGELAPYNPQFLSGFRAEGYTVQLPEGHTMGVQRMDGIIKQDVRRDIGGDEQRVHSVDTEHENERFKHVLLPIWMAAYQYRGKSYRFVVNGQTGKVQGERPWSKWKIAGAVLVAIIVLVVIMYINQGR